MPHLPLHEFIGTHRDDLIRRCKDRAAARLTSPPRTPEFAHGVPLFLDQLVMELRSSSHSQTHEISKSAAAHGHDLLREGFTVSQVVHDYGDVCQSVTELAVEENAPIDADDFRTLNRCLDDAIASAVTEHARGQEVTRGGDAQKLLNLITTAITSLDVLQTGSIGMTGKTSGVLHDSLAAILVLAGRQADTTRPPPATPTIGV